MGRYSGYGSKVTLEGYLALDTSKLKAFGYLSGHVAGQLTWTRWNSEKSTIGIVVNVSEAAPYCRLHYQTTLLYSGESRNCNYDILLTSTKCNYGGIRWWFLCPLAVDGIACHRRVRRLYKRGFYFGCRQCLNLCYEAQNENPVYRYGAYRVISDGVKADELADEIKVPYYKGKPTRKMRRYISLRHNSDELADAWYNLEVLGKSEL